MCASRSTSKRCIWNYCPLFSGLGSFLVSYLIEVKTNIKTVQIGDVNVFSSIERIHNNAVSRQHFELEVETK